jgi:hypothetical protein
MNLTRLVLLEGLAMVQCYIKKGLTQVVGKPDQAVTVEMRQAVAQRLTREQAVAVL